ncbi:MAG: CHASE2 domain-containing protein [Bacteriovoracaceae bacterium]|nr:CHASE2 domain-containing protein [Bacteriovoracaceae bacterium]
METPQKKKRIGDFTKLYPLFFTLVFVVLLFQYTFSSLESIFYDFRLKYDVGTSFEDDFVLIVMDEESDEFLGERYPYTYASHDRLLKRLIKDKPLIIDYLVRLDGPKSDSDSINMRQFKGTIGNFVENGGSFRFGTDMDASGEHLPPKGLRELGFSLSIINIDNSVFSKDDVARRALLNISGEDSLHLWTANQYRKYLGKEALDINSIFGAFYVREADATFSFFKYYTTPVDKDTRIRSIPFHRVVVGNFPKGFFTNKIILVGSSYISKPNEDYVYTPFNKEHKRASKLGVHAAIIQSFIKNKTVLKIPIKVSYVFSVFIAILLSYAIFRFHPTRGLLITVFLVGGILIISYLLFSVMGFWLQTTHLILTVLVVYYIWVPFKAIGEYQRRFAIQEESKLLKRVEGLKRNFISLMSHDLKTPVAKIAGIADITLQQNRQNPELAKNLYLIIDSTRELNKFITSILDLTKIESQKLNLQMVSKDVNPLIENVVDGLRFEANSKGVDFSLELDPLYPIQIDVNLMNRVISNLVENAIKYSGENSTVIVKTCDDADWVYIEVADNGVGITEEDLTHVFDKFYRVKNDASHSIKGTGLGLYLVKYFVELHGGSIGVRSTPGKGTIFQIKLKNA